MNKSTLFTLFFLLTTTSGTLYASTGNHWIFDMFSFFNKKNQSAPTTVHDAVGAKLIELKSYPASVENPPLNNNMHCKKVKVQGNPPQTLTSESGYIESKEMGFILQSPSDWVTQ